MKKKILIIDEEAHILILAANRLRANGYDVITALSCVQGIERIQEESPHLILLGWILSEMSSEEMMHRLKNDPDMKAIPVIVMTTDGSRFKTAEFQLRGATAILCEPYSSEELLQVVAKALG